MSKKIKIFHREVEVKVLLEVLAVHVIFALMLTGVYVLEPTITGLVTGAKQFNYSDSIDIVLNESSEYIWSLENPGKVKGIKVSGFIENEGWAKIYVENNGLRYLIFDSDKLNDKEILDKITGFVVAENKDKGKEPNHPPVWSSEQDEFILNQTLILDLNNYFDDKDGDVISYSFEGIVDLKILLEDSLLTIKNIYNIEGNKTLHLTASDNETSKKKGIILILIKGAMEIPIINETINITPTINETIENETIENETIINKSIKINLEYKVGTDYDVDDNGIETTTGIIDFTVESNKFN